MLPHAGPFSGVAMELPEDECLPTDKNVCIRVSQICHNVGCVLVDLLIFPFFSGGNCPHECLTIFDILCPR